MTLDRCLSYLSILYCMQASSKDLVLRLCDQAFLYRDLVHPPAEVVHKIAEGLAANDGEASKVQELPCV